jgi:taurine dioxygenase
MTMIAEKTGTISVHQMHPHIGAEVRGVELSRPLDDETLRQIKDAWHKHAVLVFRDQKLSEEDQRRFASNFGHVAKRVPPPPGAVKVETVAWDDMMMITDHVDANGKPVGSLGHGEMWFHTDKCYHRRPHRATFLYGIEIPSEGGDTRFSSMYAAYDKLSAELKRKLDGAMVMQGYEYGLSRRISLDHDLNNIHHCIQPLILTNPGSGRKGLYAASVNTMWIEGMDRAESEAILQQCFDIVENDAIIYDHKWRVGDLVMWDNLACLHARTDWPPEQTRTLRRCTIEGEPLY